jgi:hypothetical protein
MNIYLQIDGQEKGPFTLDELRELVVSNKVTRSTPLRFENSTTWAPMIGLFSLLSEDKGDKYSTAKTIKPVAQDSDSDPSKSGIFEIAGIAAVICTAFWFISIAVACLGLAWALIKSLF